MAYEPKVGDELILLKPNAPMDLEIGDTYGTLIAITDTHCTVKRFDGKKSKFSKAIFFDWFIKK